VPISRQTAPLEAPQDPAQVARIQSQLLPQGGRVRGRAVAELVEDARFGEREGTAQQRLLEETDLPGVEPIEAAHDGDALRQGGSGHPSSFRN